MAVLSKMNEMWRPVVGYEEYYEVSSFGRVRSLSRKVKTSWRNGKKGGYHWEKV